MKLKLLSLALLAAVPLAGCSLQPMYAGGGSGEVAQGLGLLSDDTIGRERRTLRARYQLVELGTDRIMFDATAGADAGIDVVSSEYATIAAEQTALENLSKEVADRIVTSLALQLRKGVAARP